jgi:hypothetical protein
MTNETLKDGERAVSAEEFLESMKPRANKVQDGVQLWTAWALIEAFNQGVCAATPQPLNKRAAFETWAKPHGYDLSRCSPVSYSAYKSDATNDAWKEWLGGEATGERMSEAAQAVAPKEVCEAVESMAALYETNGIYDDAEILRRWLAARKAEIDREGGEE